MPNDNFRRKGAENQFLGQSNIPLLPSYLPHFTPKTHGRQVLFSCDHNLLDEQANYKTTAVSYHLNFPTKLKRRT